MSRRRPSGFTLIEVVAAIVLSAIAMAAILPFLSSVFLRSYEPRTEMDEGLALQTAMENLVVWHSSNAGAAGTNSLELLRRYVATNLQAGIVALETNYVDFAGNAETASTNPALLKVTLANTNNEMVIRLFARPLREVP